MGNGYLVKVGNFQLSQFVAMGGSIYVAPKGTKLHIRWTAPEGLLNNLFSIKSDIWCESSWSGVHGGGGGGGMLAGFLCMCLRNVIVCDER